MTSIAQTIDGYLWLASPAGLFRFDGVRFELHDQMAAVGGPWLLLATSDGTLWVGHRRSGVSRIANGVTRSYGEADGLTPGLLLDMKVDRAGTVWAATDFGLSRFRAGRWEKLGTEWGLPARGTRAVLPANDDSIWVASSKQLLVIRPGKAQAQVTDVTGEIRTLANGPDGRIWLRDLSGLVRTLRSQSISAEDSLIRAEGRPMLFDGRGNLWTAGPTHGVQRTPLNHESETGRSGTSAPELFSAADGLTGDHVFDVFEDREANIWVATSGGIDLFRETALVEASPALNFYTPIVSACPDGSIWAGALKHALVRLAGDAVSTMDIGTDIAALHCAVDGTVWAWSGYDLWRGQRGMFTRMPPYPTRDIAVALTTDPSGRLWVELADAGLHVFEQGRWRKADLAGAASLPAGIRVALTDRAGRVWFGHRNGALSKLEHDVFSVVARTEQVPVGSVTALAAGSGRVWLGGDGGLAVADAAGARVISSLDLAATGRIKGIVEASDGSLWLNADRGVVRIDAQVVERMLADAHASPTFRVFDYLDGGLGGAGQTLPQAATQTSDGRLWFVGWNRVVTVNPASIPANTLPPNVVVETIRAGGKEYRGDDEVRLPKGTTSLQVKYTALSLTIPDRVRFRYQLSGIDAEWQDVGTRREAYYANLGPGQYTFRVIASNNDGVWNEQGTVVRFSIAPAFYQTRWFFASLAIAAACVLWVAYRLRVNQMSRQLTIAFDARVRERTRIARDLHDTLLQSVQALLIHCQAANNLLPDDPNEAKTRFDRVIDLTAHAITESRDAVYELRGAAEAPDLANAVTALGEQLSIRAPAAAGPRLEINQEGRARPLHPANYDDVSRIVSEAVRNAVRHAAASRIQVDIRFERRRLCVKIHDDGKGIAQEILTASKVAGHWGLPGMRERAEILGGRVSVRSRVGSGTEVELEVPASAAYADSGGWRFMKWTTSKAGSPREQGGDR